MASWDRQKGEPPKAYAHFTIYRDLGPDRTLTKTSQIVGVTEPGLRQESARWNWTARCDQWDAHVRSIHDRAYLSEAAKKGKQRAQAFTALLSRSLEALKQVDLKGATLAQVAQAMKVATEGMRLEEGLSTANLDLEVRDARTVIANLPAEVRTPLLRALADSVRRAEAERSSGGVPLGIGSGE